MGSMSDDLLVSARFLTDTLMSGYFANRTFFKLHHQLGVLDNPDQVGSITFWQKADFPSVLVACAVDNQVNL